MDAAATAPQLYGMFQVQHLVKEDVLDGVAGHARVIKNATDDDGIVGRIVMSEAAAGVILAPGKLRASQKPMKKPAVEIVEDFFEMVMMSAGGTDELAPAHLADQPGLGGYVVTGNVAAIAGAVGALDGQAIKLGEEDMKDGVEYGVGSAFQQIREPEIKFALPQADRVVEGDKGIETEMERRRGSARAKFAIDVVEDFGELGGHVEGRVARERVRISGSTPEANHRARTSRGMIHGETLLSIGCAAVVRILAGARFRGAR